MPEKKEQYLQPHYDSDRRLAMFYKLIEEGQIANKQITEADFDVIDGRLLLEDMASKEGMGVEQMFDGWECELATAQAFDSVEEVMEWLNGDHASSPNK